MIDDFDRRIEAYRILDAMTTGEWVQARDLGDRGIEFIGDFPAAPAARIASRLRWLRDHNLVQSRPAPSDLGQRPATEWCITDLGRARRTLNARFGMPVRSPEHGSEVPRGEEGIRQGAASDLESARH